MLHFPKTVGALTDAIVQSAELRSPTSPEKAYVVDSAIYACMEVIALHIGALPKEQQSSGLLAVTTCLPMLVEKLKPENFPKAAIRESTH